MTTLCRCAMPEGLPISAASSDLVTSGNWQSFEAFSDITSTEFSAIISEGIQRHLTAIENDWIVVDLTANSKRNLS